ncbi:putative virion structural protein [Serratia phage vB_SmaS-Totoro]|nr:putative virion structural protein [Serratia phage vB_SmaS-Totoro]
MKLSLNLPLTPMDVVGGLKTGVIPEAIAISTAANAVAKVGGAIANNYKESAGSNAQARALMADSLIDYAQPTRVEPLTLVDAALYQQPYMEDILQSLLNLFAGYYTQAIALSAEVAGVTVLKRLEQFNPRRDPRNNLVEYAFGAISSSVAKESASVVSNEAFRFGLPALESDASNKGGKDSSKPSTLELSNRETLNSLRENSNLAVGKMIEVSVIVDDKTFKVPVNVRLHTIPVPSSAMTSILTAGAQDRSTKERYYEMKAGNLRFLKDFIGVGNLLDAHRKNILKDPTGLYLKSLNDKRNNTISGFLSGRPSVAQASQINVITEETAIAIERQLSVKLNTPRGRAIMESNSPQMLLVVVDRDYNQVTIYHRGVPGATVMSVESMKNAGKGQGPDIMKMFEMYKQTKAPTF